MKLKINFCEATSFVVPNRKIMKLKINFSEASRYVVPSQKIIQGQILFRPMNWRDIRKLAMAERPKPCRRGE